MRWLLMWRALWVFVQFFPPPAGGVPEWTKTDSESLRRYLVETETGRKLARTLAVQEAEVNAGAVLRRDAAEYACGFAAGFRAGNAWLSALSASDQPEEVTMSQSGLRRGSELAESLAP